MESSFPLSAELPAAAKAAVSIVRQLSRAGHAALLAGGCVRDLLLDRQPQDYDVATDAPPDRVRQLFQATRLVGAQFGVVLVRQSRRWIEVATFRSDGPYHDGRHPAGVRFTNAGEDARRRDFTVNGMFLDPISRTVIDYVDGRADLRARVIRAIGDPAARFEEDHLRLLRAVRFAARLEFTIEPATLAAIKAGSAKLASVAAERVREELEKTLSHPSRSQAYQLLRETGLLAHLWPQANWQANQLAAAEALLTRLPADAAFELAFAALLADRGRLEIHSVARALAFSNEQRETVAWLVEHQADLDAPDAIALADLKRLMVHPAFRSLRQLAETGGSRRTAALARRLASIAPETIQPPPLVNGGDLMALDLPPGPAYKEILDALYTRQLNELIHTREEALALLNDLLRERGVRE